MTESSSAGHPDGGGLPADHPLGPAVPIPPTEKETERGGDIASGDRREDVLDPSAGAAGHAAETIRDEQGTHSADAVPAAFNGPGTPENLDEDRRPEDAGRESDTWDSAGSGD